MPCLKHFCILFAGKNMSDVIKFVVEKEQEASSLLNRVNQVSTRVLLSGIYQFETL